MALRIQHLIKEAIIIEGTLLQMGCSIGVHLISPEAKGAELELKEAYSAMYQAKNTQRGSIVFLPLKRDTSIKNLTRIKF